MTFTPPSNTTPPQSSSYVSIDSPTDRCALSSSILGCSFLEHPDGGFEPYIAIQSPSTSESTLKRTGWSPGRFIMTPVRASDAEAQVEKNNHPAIYNANPGPALPYTSEQGARFVTRHQALERTEFTTLIDFQLGEVDHWAATKWFPFLIIRDTQPEPSPNQDDEASSTLGSFAGEVALLKVGDGEWVIGCDIHPKLWGLGLATAAVKLVLTTWAYPNVHHCRLIKAETHSDNIASQKVYLKCGFVKDEEKSGSRHTMHESRGGKEKIEWVYTWGRDGQKA